MQRCNAHERIYQTNFIKFVNIYFYTEINDVQPHFFTTFLQPGGDGCYNDDQYNRIYQVFTVFPKTRGQVMDEKFLIKEKTGSSPHKHHTPNAISFYFIPFHILFYYTLFSFISLHFTSNPSNHSYSILLFLTLSYTLFLHYLHYIFSFIFLTIFPYSILYLFLNLHCRYSKIYISCPYIFY